VNFRVALQVNGDKMLRASAAQIEIFVRSGGGKKKDAFPEVVSHQAEASEEAEAEPADPSVDSFANREHHSIQCKASALAANEAWPVNFQFLSAFGLRVLPLLES